MTQRRKQLELELSGAIPQMDPEGLDYSDWLPIKVTPVFAAYWRFAVSRQSIYFKRLNNEPPPWTDDPILQEHKFTNVYRAADRVSQYLIRHVIYQGDDTPDEVCFRTLLFKLFNKIETWELLQVELGTLSWATYDFASYNHVLTQAMERGDRIFSAAYIMPSGKSSFGYERKHSNCLKLVEQMMKDELAGELRKCQTMRTAFDLLKSYPMIGDFLAYQLVTDLNYSVLTDFSESEFVVAGPGAQDGITKCFSYTAGLGYEEIIRLMQRRQDLEFDRHGLSFQRLGNRKLQLIDCQNIFCEISKYARVAFPDQKGVSNRHRIKQKFRPQPSAEIPWFPPKWGINRFFD